MTRSVIYTILGALVIVLIGVYMAYSQSEKIGRFLINPRTPYQTYTRPKAPQYDRDDSWAALPWTQSRAKELPDGMMATTMVPEADVFFVYPTTYYKAMEWNGPLTSRKAGIRIDDVAMPAQASAFNAAGRIFAPRYRQATLYAFQTLNHDGRLAQRAAYADVADAFSYYLQNHNDGRPLIFAGSGQGALHIIRLLQEYVVGKDLQKRFVAAYIIDFAFPLDLFDISLNTLSLCQSADETQCIISWNTLESGQDPHLIQGRSQVWNIFGSLQSTADRPLACINPLTWEENELPAPASLNLGGISVDRIGNSGPVPQITGAQCRKGILYVNKPEDVRFHHFEWPGAEHRLAQFNFFYMNIRENAALRAQAFLKKWRPQEPTSQTP